MKLWTGIFWYLELFYHSQLKNIHVSQKKKKSITTYCCLSMGIGEDPMNLYFIFLHLVYIDP